jgi:outer membrane receptor protein involved in Fe transport
MKKTAFLVAGTAISLSFFASVPAFAQNSDAASTDKAATNESDETEEESGPSSETILVTGSRISRPNLSAAVPITSVDVEDLTDTGNLSLGDAVNQLPQLRSTFSQANSTRAIGTAGLNILDLRGLGTARSLVLVNGRRHVSATPGSYSVDVNTIPTALLERVDVVTGGNSAVYGSDAVSGVVNFILKRDYDGFEMRAQAGVSSRGDRGSRTISGLFGRNFADGRGNVAVSAEYARSSTLLFSDRPGQTGAFGGTPGFNTVDADIQCSLDASGNPIPGSIPFCDPNVRAASDGISDTYFFANGTNFGNISLGGTLNPACPAVTATNAAQRAAVCTGRLSVTGGRLADSYNFLADGSLVRDTPSLDLRPQGGGRFGGLTATGSEGAMLLPGLERIATNLLARFEFSPAAEVFFEGKYVKTTNNQTSGQPTFVNSRLSPTFFLDNPFLTAQAQNTIRLINGIPASNTTAAFTMFRFNNDIGTRSEDHERETFRVVGGVRGVAGANDNWRYEVALNYGKTDTYYKTGGNVDVAKFNNASNAVRNASGQIVCRINADASTTNDDPNCRPINLFGINAPQTTPEGLAYVLYTSEREQWAKQFDVTAFVSGDTTGFIELPGGPIGIAVGMEYRTEDAYSAYDPFTASGATFLNSFGEFDPKKIKVAESFAELRFPLLSDVPFAHELTIDGAARVADYSNAAKPVWAYNVGAVWAPVPDIRFRVSYARSVRAPDLGDLYTAASQTFANNLNDPCDQNNIGQNPNRARNCAAAGIPTSILLPGETTARAWTNTLTSGLPGINSGNELLDPEVGKSLTVGAVFQPSFLPGFTLSVDYYDIKISDAINSLTGQAIINRCYDDPVSIDNPFCAVVFRRPANPANPIESFTFVGQGGRRFAGVPDFALGTAGNGFISQPFNFAKLTTSGIDLDASYAFTWMESKFNLRAIVSWLEQREQFTYITDPARSDRIHGTLGDPRWQAQFSMNADFGDFDLAYDMRYVGKQAIALWEVQNSHQGRSPTNADAFPVKNYPAVFYHDIQLGFSVADKLRFYAGVDNIRDQLPPWGLTGTGAGSGIYPVTGRYFYGGVRVRY